MTPHSNLVLEVTFAASHCRVAGDDFSRESELGVCDGLSRYEEWKNVLRSVLSPAELSLANPSPWVRLFAHDNFAYNTHLAQLVNMLEI